jgi:hypothetical protein
VARVEKLTRKTAQQAARQILRELETELNDAFAAFDVDKGRLLRDRWNRLAREATLPPSDPLHERVAPALEWLAVQDRRLADERRYQAALQKLQAALDGPSTGPQLEGLAQAVQQLGRDLPAELAQRYRARLDALRSAARRRTGLLVGTAVGAAVFAACLVTYFVIRANRESRMAAATQALQQLVDAGNIGEARRELERLGRDNPVVAARPEIEALRQRVALAEENERRRHLDFEMALTRAEATAVDEVEPPALAQARDLVRTADEAAAVERMVRVRERERKKERAQRDRAFKAHLQELDDRLGRLEKAVAEAADPADAGLGLRQLETQAARLRQEAAGVSDDLRDSLKAAETRLASLRQKTAEVEGAARLEKRLTAAVHPDGHPGEYVAALEAYRKEFPATARGQDFERALKEQPHWQAVRAWDDLIGPWRDNPLKISPGDARKLLARCREFLQSYPQFVDAAVARHYADALEGVARRDPADRDGAAAGLQTVFADFLVKEVWMVRTRDDRTYYLMKDDLNVEPEFFTFHYFEGLDKGQRRTKSLRRTAVAASSRAPQSVIAETVRKLTTNFTAYEPWDATMVKIAQAVASDEQVDPILQIILLKNVVDCASAGSLPLAGALAPHRRYLDQQKQYLSLSWMDPENKRADNARGEARQVVRSFPSLDGVAGEAKRSQHELEQAIARARYTPAGWLARDRRGAWQCRAEFGPPEGQELGVLVSKTEAEAVWKPIGKVVTGEARIDPANSDALVEGRLVFARPPADGP